MAISQSMVHMTSSQESCVLHVQQPSESTAAAGCGNPGEEKATNSPDARVIARSALVAPQFNRVVDVSNVKGKNVQYMTGT